MLLDMIIISVASFFFSKASTKLVLQINFGYNFVLTWFFNYSSDSVKMILDARKGITVSILVKTAFVTRARTVTIITGKY